MELFKRKLLIFIFVCIITFPFVVSAQDDNSQGQRLKIVCYNLRFGELASLEQLAEYIKSENPDIVALQEVDVKTNRERAPHQNGKDFITELGFRTGMLTAYARTIDYSGGYYGIGILSKYPLEQTQKVMLPIPEGSKEQRAVLLVNVELPFDKRFTFVTTHLDHSSSAVRAIQVKALNKALKKNPLPFIVCGDFNAKPDSPEIKKGMKKYLQLCTDDYTIPSNEPKSKIDYIFGAPVSAWKPLKANTPGVHLSDHLPVVAEVELLQ